MELTTVLEARRSIRKYDASKKVTREQVETLIQAAIQAPSWKNSQTARYYVVESDEMIEAFRASCLPEFNANNTAGAVYIVATFVKNRSGFDMEANAVNEAGNGWGYYDLGLHNANLILKATELGLGTLIMGIRDEANIRKMLEIPETELVVAVIGVGYPAVSPEKPKRKTTEDIVKFY